jgi:chloramphenicol-sensitive protein RarD
MAGPLMNAHRHGIVAMIVACTLWGLSPLYYMLLDHVPPPEILAHRTMWSLVFFALLLAGQGRLHEMKSAFATRSRFGTILLAALLVSVNWGVFITSIQIGLVREAALGYYIFPLVAVVFGVVFFGERLGRAQWGALVLATSGVLVLTIGQGTAPWIALVLAATFGLYGVIKKRLPLGPVVSVASEVLMLAPVALIWLGWLWTDGQGAFGTDLSTSLLLMASGVMTGFPLVLFARAAQQVPLATVGLLQYINPTLQFLCAVTVLAEPFTRVHAISFALIWLALGVYSVALVLQEKARSKSASAASTDPAV